jgi:hypothetical protein
MELVGCKVIYCKIHKRVKTFAAVMIISKWAEASEISRLHTRVYPKVSGLADCSKNCEWYSSLALGAVVSLFRESV